MKKHTPSATAKRPRRERLSVRTAGSVGDFLSYTLFMISVFSLTFLGENREPYALPVLYAALNAGLGIIFCTVTFALCGFATGSVSGFVCYAAPAVLFAIVYALLRKFRARAGKCGVLICITALIPSAVWLPWQNYALPDFLMNPLYQKLLFGGILLILCPLFDIAVNALLQKVLVCRLRPHEMLFLCLVASLVGAGLYKCTGGVIYADCAVFVLLVFTYIARNASCFACALVLSLAPMLAGFSVSPGAELLAYACVALLFLPSGRFAQAFMVFLTQCGIQYFYGLYSQSVQTILLALAILAVPDILFLAIPRFAFRAIAEKVVFYREDHLARITVNANRAVVGEKLFDLSNVFREISASFATLSAVEDEESEAQNFLADCVEQEVCKKCAECGSCPCLHSDSGLSRLVAVGAVKGKISAADFPSGMNDCILRGEVQFTLNKMLAQYRMRMTESKNAAEGRKLLSAQALGVSEVLRNLAMEQSVPLKRNGVQEKKLAADLARAGILCVEIRVDGEAESGNGSVSLILCGEPRPERIEKTVSSSLGQNLVISEKFALTADRFCVTLRARPVFDAAFGVAARTKDGEAVSGDTHSVVRIDEKRFMAILCDGMGSGKNANAISTAAIGLLESFYKAKMPSELVLDTINRLLTFNVGESFACIDVGMIDLEQGRLDVVKIGSPTGFVLSSDKIRVLQGESMPLGILSAIEPSTAVCPVGDGDIVTFLSDGVIDAFGSTADLYAFLQNGTPLNPQALADGILSEALRISEGKAKDDMTVLCVRIFCREKSA